MTWVAVHGVDCQKAVDSRNCLPTSLLPHSSSLAAPSHSPSLSLSPLPPSCRLVSVVNVTSGLHLSHSRNSTGSTHCSAPHPLNLTARAVLALAQRATGRRGPTHTRPGDAL